MNWLLLNNSLLVSAGTALGAAALGFWAALLLLACAEGTRRFLFILWVAILALPSFLVTNAWLSLMSPQTDPALGLYGTPGVIWILTLMWWPIPALAVYAGWQRLSPSILEAEPLLTGPRLLRYLLWPAARAPLAWSSVVVATLALGNFAVPAILQVKVLPVQMWIRFNTDLDTGATFSAAWPLVLIPALMLLWFWRRSVDWPARPQVAAHPLWRRQLGRSFLVISAGVSLLAVLLSLVLPLGGLILESRTWSEMPGAFAAGKSALAHSVFFAVVTSLCCIALSFLTWRSKWAALSWLLFFAPGVLLQVAIIAALNRPAFSWLYPGVSIVVLALTLKYFAFVHALVAHAFGSIDKSLYEAAALAGANRWQLIRHVYWPQGGGMVLAAAGIAYILCLWDVESVLLVMPPGSESLSLRVFNLLHYGHNAQVSALCLLLLGSALLPALCTYAWRLVSRRRWQTTALLVLAACLAISCRPASPTLESALFKDVVVLGKRGAGVGEFSKPRSLTLDPSNNVYVADMTGRVQKFAPDGHFLLSWQMPQTDLGRPKGMGCDRQGNILINEPHYSRVNRFSPEGKLLHQWGTHGTNAGQLAFPRAVAANSHDDLIVSEYGSVERIQVFSANGATLRYALGKAGNGPGEFNRPEGLTVDTNDAIYVADSCNHRIQVFDAHGKFVREFGKAGSGPGELSYPYDVAVGRDGLVYVCEFGNSRIQVFQPDGTTVEVIGSPGAAPGQFANPWSIAFDSQGNLYVADSQNHRVQKLVRRQALAGGTR